MIVLRPAQPNDICYLERFANASGPLVSTLPESHTHLLGKVEQSKQSFAKAVTAPSNESYLFVLEDSSTGRLLGTGGINALAGNQAPFYSYRTEFKIHASRKLNVNNRVKALILNHDLSDHSQLCSFYIDPEFAESLYPSVITLGRLLYMSVAPQRFSDQWMAVLPGIFDEHGVAPFWEHVGRKFCDIDYSQVEYYNSTREKTFIVEMMPYHPLYVTLMHKEAQDVIGLIHERAALQNTLLTEQGFGPDNYVEIFDAGAILTARRKDILLTQQTKFVQLVTNEKSDTPKTFMVGIKHEDGFKSYLINGVLEGDQLHICSDDLTELKLPVGTMVHAVALTEFPHNQVRN
ncbi:arginine N-succinyltransferase [Vibrio sp. WJH972]